MRPFKFTLRQLRRLFSILFVAALFFIFTSLTIYGNLRKFDISTKYHSLPVYSRFSGVSRYLEISSYRKNYLRTRVYVVS